MASIKPEEATLCRLEERFGHELGVVRISLGLVSDFKDVYRVVEFAQMMGREKDRSEMWVEWMAERARTGHESRDRCV